MLQPMLGVSWVMLFSRGEGRGLPGKRRGQLAGLRVPLCPKFHAPASPFPSSGTWARRQLRPITDPEAAGPEAQSYLLLCCMSVLLPPARQTLPPAPPRDQGQAQVLPTVPLGAVGESPPGVGWLWAVLGPPRLWRREPRLRATAWQTGSRGGSPSR